VDQETRTAGIIGLASSLLAVVEGVAYLGVIVLLILRGTMPPPEPWASVVAALLLVTVPTLLALSVATCWLASPGRRPWAVLSLACMTIFGVYVSISRLLQLSLLRPHWGQAMAPELALLNPYGVPSLGFTLEIGGWGLWLGLAFLALSAAFSGPGRRRAIRLVFVVSGLLSLVAALGPVLGDSRWTTPGIIAWGPGLLIGVALLALEFRASLRRAS
jgi:hypothetical protein